MKQLYICLLATGTLMSACTADWLNLDPSTSVTTEQAFTTLQDAQTALNGIYRETSQHSYYGDIYWYYGDCRAADVQARITGPSRIVPYYSYNVLATDNNNVVLPWNRPYLVIRQANNLIGKIDEKKIQSNDIQSLNRMKAEALVLRGLALFNLTRLYGMPYTNDNGTSPGVPIEVTPANPDHRPARNTVAECYSQVIKDMTDALNIGLTKEKKNGYINYWAVQALLSRIYLNKGDYSNAFKCAEEVITQASSLYHLYSRDEYPKVWGQDFQAESIFELYIDTSEPSEWGGGTGGEGAPSVYENNTSQSGWNNLILSEDYLKLLAEDPQDIRNVLTQMPSVADDKGLPETARKQKVFLTKFPGKNDDVKLNDICIIRLAEVYLNAAEAGLKLGGEAKNRGMNYLNELICQRTPTTTQQVESGNFTIARILKERRKELVGEGLVYFDYLRTQTPIERKGSWHLPIIGNLNAQTIQHTDKRIILPIPQAEIDANPNMTQNP